MPDTVVTPRMFEEEHGEETFPLHRSRYLIEPLPEMASSKKDTGLASIYVPFRNICPFAYAIDIHKGRPTSSYHGSMFCAMERMATLSLVYQQYVRAKWPHALMYYGGIYLGAELLVVGDAVRIESNFKIKGCYEILIINSIKLRFNGIQPEPNGRTVTGKRADFQRLYFRGKALFGILSSCLRLLVELRDMLGEQVTQLAPFLTPETRLVTQIFIKEWKC